MENIGRKELFTQLHYYFTGKPDTVHGTIRVFESYLPSIGIAKAQKYIEVATYGQQHAASEEARYLMRNDLILAQALLAIFEHLHAGADEFPPLPKITDLGEEEKRQNLRDWMTALKASRGING